jgi:hypothetical protein
MGALARRAQLLQHRLDRLRQIVLQRRGGAAGVRGALLGAHRPGARGGAQVARGVAQGAAVHLGMAALMRQHLGGQAAARRHLARQADAVLGLDQGQADLGGQGAGAGLGRLGAHGDLAARFHAEDGQAEVMREGAVRGSAGLRPQRAGRHRRQDAGRAVLDRDDHGRHAARGAGDGRRRAGLRRRRLGGRRGRGGSGLRAGHVGQQQHRQQEQPGPPRHSHPLRLK